MCNSHQLTFENYPFNNSKIGDFNEQALVLCTSNAFCGGFCDLGSWNTWQRGEEESADKPTNAVARKYFKVAHPAFKTVQNSGYMQKKIQCATIHGEIINSKWAGILCSSHLNVEFLYQQECWNSILFPTVMKLANSTLNLVSRIFFFHPWQLWKL